MKLRFHSSFSLIVILFFACNDKEEIYPIEPHIEFEDVSFIDSPLTDMDGFLLPDTLKLTFNFTDGDADFGFLDFEDKFPYQMRSYFLRSSGLLVPYEKVAAGQVRIEDLLSYKDRSHVPNDTLPVYEYPYSCLNWEVITKVRNNIETVVDTLYFQFNPDAYNIDVDFLLQQSDGSFIEFDFRQTFCSTYNTRSMATNGDTGPVSLKLFSSKRGRITYRMSGMGFKVVFGNKPLKLRFFIKDRALNHSNVVETPVFTIPSP